MQIRSFLVAALAAGTAMAHMNMKDPPPLAYKGNPNAKEPNIDYSITSPITQAQYPCKGYLKLLGTPEGASVKTYAPGGQYTMSVEGGAYHDGGSCQLSLSYDKGASFTVIKSFIGNCPTSSGGTFNFDMPSDAPEGDNVVFAWTWVNHTGNREYYMSCAVVTIKAGASKRGDVPAIEAKRATTAFASRPKVFEANLGGQYCTKEGVDTVYPEPGPDVENTSTSPGPAILCSTGADAPEGSTGGSDSGSGSSAGASSAATSAATSAAATSAAATSAAATSAAASSAAGGGIQVSASMYVTPSSQLTPASSASLASPSSLEVLTVIPITGLTSSSTGGVFVTVAPSSTGAAASSAAAPTTFSTATIASQSAGAGTGAASSAAAGGSSGSATTSAQAPTGTGGVTGTQSGACTDEGAWACAPDGSSFQRCASGQWSAAMPMAQGTKCNPGISNTLSMRRRDRVRRSGTGLSRVAF
ncbi:uncharacterized protein F4807DRAFT_68635 [Annulohypoxylon truncatum]|uniref:uncharacterized protein n=1 Tax=Annulohypoxylon truncatum TaxID=327061 RepID=UPI0020084F3E|nr:uncharacterized protein F4807DRAFT_68635 [Annulohypoxylon truncatum]KAI1210503.1 hypothetical protein F4807DRAFT_68635 [Annulohypoxylon truncatum]